MNYPYRVTFRLPSDEGRFHWIKWILASDSKEAKELIKTIYCSHGNEARIISARKQTLSKCAFYKKFGAKNTKLYY